MGTTVLPRRLLLKLKTAVASLGKSRYFPLCGGGAGGLARPSVIEGGPGPR